MNRTSLQNLWATRPVRRRDGRKVAGVCAGVAARYDVDPTLVRIAFVVSAFFGGGGVLLYLVAVFALPSAGRAPVNRERRESGPGLAEILIFGVLTLLALIMLGSFGQDRFWGTSATLGIVLMLLGWWLLYQRTPVPPAGTAAEAAPAPPGPVAGPPTTTARVTPVAPEPAGPPDPVTDADEAPTDVIVDDALPAAALPPAVLPSSGTAATQPLPAAATTGPATAPLPESTAPIADDDAPWDPLSTSRYAWEQTGAPAAAGAPPIPEEPSGPRSALTPVVSGAAVLVAAAGTGANLLGAEWFTVGRIAALALAVLGLGLVFAGLRSRSDGSGSGLLPLAFLSAAVVIVATMIHASGWTVPSGGIGDRHWQATTSAELQPTYELTVGSSTLDLRNLRELDRDRTVQISQGIGEIKVHLPTDVRSRVQCTATIGEVDCPQGIRGAAAPEDSPLLTVKAHTGMGKVEIVR